MSATAIGDSVIREALAIRKIVLPLLANDTLTDEGSVLLGGISESAWRLFLHAECCAAPVAVTLRRLGLFDRLPSATIVVVRAAESRELQRALSARAQLRQVDQVAHACGLSAIVLKGGAMAAEGGLIDLGDLDFACNEAERDSLQTALIGCGYTVEWTAGPAPTALRATPPTTPLAFGGHLPRLVIGGGLPIELHLTVTNDPVNVHPAPRMVSPDHGERGAGADDRVLLALSDSTRLLRGFRSLVRRVGAAPLHDVLRHVVVQHTFRRGHIRDLIVLADAIGECQAEELAAVRRRCLRDLHADELVAVLDQATAIATRMPIIDPEPTRQVVARKYALVSGREAWVTRAVPRWTWRLAYVPLERAPLRRFELASLLRDVNLNHPIYQLARIRTHAPRVADLISTMMATGYRAVLAGAVAGAGPLIRRRMKRLLDDRPARTLLG